MITNPYNYEGSNDKTLYVFISKGPNGNITKIVLFTKIGGRKWNLAFGDYLNKDMNDKVISNNQDIVMVIGTVSKIAAEFLDSYPETIISIKPVDDKRRRLYNTVFQRYYGVIEPIYNVYGFIKNRKLLYSPLKSYDRFEVSLKI